MSLEKQLADTDSIYCTKVTNSNQSSIFISNLGEAELEVLFGANYGNDDAVRLCLDKRNLAFNAVAHTLDGKTWYKRKTTERWVLDLTWLNARIKDLERVFASEREVFVAHLNKDDHSTKRLYLKGITSLAREDGSVELALRDFLFSGDVIVLTKQQDGTVLFEVKIPDNPIIAFDAKKNIEDLKNLPRQLIVYGAPGTGKSYATKRETDGHAVYRTTFHPDSDYSTFVGCYKPTMRRERKTYVLEGKEAEVKGDDGTPVFDEKIAYDFVPQAFTKAYVKAWQELVEAQADGGASDKVFLVIEEINRGNCAQIFGDLFQLLDRDADGFSDYEIAADDDLRRYLAEAFRGVNLADATERVPPGIAAKLARVFAGEILLLPANLYIRATMNTSDQSLFPIDSAFKRRWEWKYVPISEPDAAGWKKRVIVANGKAYDWWSFLEFANEQILDTTKSEDKQLGYFFVKASDATGRITADQFTGKVLFYLYNDVFKDYTLPTSLFGDGTDGGVAYAFKAFFDAHGETKEDVVAAFLDRLEVPNAPLDGEADGAAEPAAVEPAVDESASAEPAVAE